MDQTGGILRQQHDWQSPTAQKVAQDAVSLSVHHCLRPKPPLPCSSPFPPRRHLVSKRGAKCGGVTERLKELAWKASEGQKPSGGSNPPLSAILHTAREGGACRVPSKGAA